MIGAEVYVQLDGRRTVYQPGETLSGEYHLESLSLSEPAAIEVSVVWHTEGQGDEDLAVHYFERLDRDERPEVDLRRPQRFSVSLPRSPLSYEGLIVKIRWCVRVRVFLSRGKELFAEAPFQLGTVPPGRLVDA
ncbi:MAG TPA: hypothetical protein VMV10_01030 [Pirellulales bacterium]|nr:hypothetical protein [Pirellulales bacterium]